MTLEAARQDSSIPDSVRHRPQAPAVAAGDEMRPRTTLGLAAPRRQLLDHRAWRRRDELSRCIQTSHEKKFSGELRARSSCWSFALADENVNALIDQSMSSWTRRWAAKATTCSQRHANLVIDGGTGDDRSSALQRSQRCFVINGDTFTGGKSITYRTRRSRSTASGNDNFSSFATKR